MPFQIVNYFKEIRSKEIRSLPPLQPYHQRRVSRQLGIEEHEGYLVMVLMVLNWIKIAGVSPYASFLLKVF